MPQLTEHPPPGGPSTKWTAHLARFGESQLIRERLLGGAVQGLMSAFAAIVAYFPAKPLGLREGFWSSITAIAVVQTELSAVRSSARDQFTGAAVGGLIGALTLTWLGRDLIAYALAILVSITICWLFNVSSAARLAGTTATIVCLVPHDSTTGWMMISRIAEVGWGVTVALLTVILVNKLKATVARGPQSRPK